MSSTEKINFLRKRDFGDLLQDSIQFVVQNSRTIIRALVLYVGPLFLFSAIVNTLYFRESGLANLNLEALMSDPMSALSALNASTPGWGIVSLSYLLSLATFVVLVAAMNSIILQYNDSPTGGVVFERIWEDIKAYSLPFAGLTLLNALVFFGVYIVGVLVLIAGVSMFGSSAAVVLVLIPLAAIFYMATFLPLTYIIRMNEGLTASQSIYRAYQLIKGRFWQTFGLLFIIFLVLIMLALGLYGMAGVFAFVFGEKFINLGALLVIGGLVGSLINSLLYSVVFSAIGLQYFNLQEITESHFESSRIDEIGKEDDEEQI